jgi:hypothetical protein
MTTSKSNAPPGRAVERANAGAPRGVMVGGTQVQDARTKAPFFSLDLVDLDRASNADPAAQHERKSIDAPDARAVRRIAMKFFVHGFTVDPARPHVAATFEKKGPGGALVDLAAGEVLLDLAPRTGCAFYGHGAYADDGAVVFCVETELATRRGVLTVRDARDFRVLEEFETFGQNPHDCVLLDGSTLLVTNGGAPHGDADGGCVTVIDVATRALVERLDIPTDRLNAGHLSAASAATFTVSSAPRDGLSASESPGGVTFRNGGGALVRARADESVTDRMLGESLSVCVHAPSGLAVVTNPWGDLLTLWNAGEGALIEARTMDFPRGVALTLDGGAFAIAHGRMPSLSLFSVDGVELLHRAATGVISGSHVYAWDPNAPARSNTC